MTLRPDKPILVVDDEPIVLVTVTAMLGRLGWADVDQARDGEEALRHMAGRAYQLVIFDWHMEPLNGDGFLRRIEGREDLRRTRLLLMTTDTDFETIRLAGERGVTDFILKPFSVGTLEARLAAL